MIDQNETPQAGHTDAEGNKGAWVTPRIERMRAGDAEVGTRTRNDGAFTQS